MYVAVFILDVLAAAPRHITVQDGLPAKDREFHQESPDRQLWLVWARMARTIADE